MGADKIACSPKKMCFFVSTYLTIVQKSVFSPFTVFEVLNPDELYLYSALLKFFIYVSLFPLMCSPTLKTNYAILPTGIISIKQILFEHILQFINFYTYILSYFSTYVNSFVIFSVFSKKETQHKLM